MRMVESINELLGSSGAARRSSQRKAAICLSLSDCSSVVVQHCRADTSCSLALWMDTAHIPAVARCSPHSLSLSHQYQRPVEASAVTPPLAHRKSMSVEVLFWHTYRKYLCYGHRIQAGHRIASRLNHSPAEVRWLPALIQHAPDTQNAGQGQSLKWSVIGFQQHILHWQMKVSLQCPFL